MVDQAIETVRSNIIWMNNNYDTILDLVSSLSLTIRLPTDLSPTHYDVTLQPTLGGDFKIYGSESILMHVTRATTRIVLHSADITIMESSIKVG